MPMNLNNAGLNAVNKIRLFMAIDGRIYRDALLYSLVSQKDVELVGESSKGVDTLALLAPCLPTTLIIEEGLKDLDGLTVAEMALSKQPSLSIILLVDTDISQNRLAIYLDAGIKSVISKTQSIHDLVQALNYTRNGQIYIDAERYRTQPDSKSLSHNVASGHRVFSDQDARCHDLYSARFDALSEREQEVASYMADHHSLNRIAEQLGVSNKTIHTYKERVFVKLGFQNLAELIVFMKRMQFFINLNKDTL
jgi:DNA-binding NarL/FixJ family response regulator